ncbi:hypothetical protein ACEPAI_9948 [Sanghuangporus weigelae]
MGAGPVASGPVTRAYDHLLDPNRKWHNNWRLICLNAWIMLFLITSSTNGYDGSMMNGLQSLYQWQESFDYPSGSMLGLLNAIQNIGAVAAYPFAPYLSDGLGRRPTVFIGAVIMIAAATLQTASQNVNMFIGSRFMIGFGLTFAANAAPMLVSEISYPPHRAPLTSLYNALWYSGSIIAAWTTYGTFKIPSSWSWRTPSAVQGLPSVIQVALVFFAPESPRYLISKGKEQQALRILAYYHADGNERDPLVQYEFEEIRAAIELDREVNRNVGWKSLVTKKGNLKRLRVILAIAFFSQWSGNGLVSYYLKIVLDGVGITNPTTQLLINGLLQIWNLFVAVFASFLCERAGRRLLFLSSAAGMCVFFSCQTACAGVFANTGDMAAAYSVIVFIFLYYGAYDIAFSPLIVSYTIEITPYNIRAKVLTLFNFTISVALIFNQYVNPVALDDIQWKYYIVYCVWILFEFVYCWVFVVETKNRSLEETAALFDGEEAVTQVAAVAHGIRDDHRVNDKDSGLLPAKIV